MQYGAMFSTNRATIGILIITNSVRLAHTGWYIYASCRRRRRHSVLQSDLPSYMTYCRNLHFHVANVCS